MYRSILFSLVIGGLLCLAGPVLAVITTSAGFLQANPQIFPVGDLVNVGQIDDGEDVDLSTLPDIIYVEISSADPDELDQEIVVHVELSFDGTQLVNFWSMPFLLRDWVESSHGSGGYFTNSQLGDFLNDGSVDLDANEARTTYADVPDMLNLLDGSNIGSGIMFVTLEAYDSTGTVLLSTHASSTPVYNPSSPELQSPVDGDVVQGYPVLMSWSWYGGSVGPNGWTLIVVEGDVNDDGETVIATRTGANTRYEGPPITEDTHHYTGVFSSEQELSDGSTYFWQVQANPNTVIPGESRVYQSNVGSFTFQSGGPGGGGGGPGGGGSPGGGDGNLGGGGGASGPIGSDDSGPVPPGELDPVVNLLSDLLPPDLMSQLSSELQGFTLSSVTIDGLPGTTQQALSLLNNQQVNIVTVRLEP